MANFFSGLPPAWGGTLRAVNRAALEVARPWAWRRILDGLPEAPRPVPVTGPGVPFNLELDGRLLHAPRDPAGEADDLVRAALPARRQALIVVGFGAGYVVEQALRRVPTGCGVVAAVVDPGALLVTLAERDLAEVIADPRLVLAVGDLREVDAAIPGGASSLAWILHEPLVAAAAADFEPLIARARAAGSPGDGGRARPGRERRRDEEL